MAMIKSTPGVCSGDPRIAGTRIRTRDVFGYFVFGGVEAVLHAYPHLTKQQVEAAVEFEKPRQEAERKRRADQRREQRDWKHFREFVESFEAQSCSDGTIWLIPKWAKGARQDWEVEENLPALGVLNRMHLAELVGKLVNRRLHGRKATAQ